MYVCMYACMHACVYEMNVCVNVVWCMYACMHACMHGCMHAWAFMQLWIDVGRYVDVPFYFVMFWRYERTVRQEHVSEPWHILMLLTVWPYPKNRIVTQAKPTQLPKCWVVRPINHVHGKLTDLHDVQPSVQNHEVLVPKCGCRMLNSTLAWPLTPAAG